MLHHFRDLQDRFRTFTLLQSVNSRSHESPFTGSTHTPRRYTRKPHTKRHLLPRDPPESRRGGPVLRDAAALLQEHLRAARAA